MLDLPGALELHHVGIVVADLDETMAQYTLLGFTDPDRFEIPAQGIEAVTYRTGAGYVELIHPTDPDGPIARFLAKRGNTVHHVAFRVDDLPAALAKLAADGVRLIDTLPRRGAHDWSIAFVHPESCGGVLVELVDDRAGDS